MGVTSAPPRLWQPELDSSPVSPRIGLLLLATDHTTERDFARLCPNDEVTIYANRIAYENPTTPDNLRRMHSGLPDAAALILPGAELDVLCYSCTAASVVIGDAEVEAALQSAKPGTPVVTPSGAAREALQLLGTRRISILTPYLPETGGLIAAYFSTHGFEIANLTCFGLEDDRDMARVKPAEIVAAARESIAPEAEALFISCTGLRAAEVAQEIEQSIGRPVVTSNQASAWLSLRTAGVQSSITGSGRLLTLSGPK
ncbi:MAG: ectoine utilization protein EutA [Gammaproteobacteria bacterium]|nr:ectoine utilization protein EutA [Gammaproteobacteria bacterium]